jgi:hypothetical protein
MRPGLNNLYLRAKVEHSDADAEATRFALFDKAILIIASVG